MPLTSRSGCQSNAIHVRVPENEHQPILAERFKTKMCRTYEQGGVCTYDSRCMFAHGEQELRTEAQNLADGLTTEAAIKAFRKKSRTSSSKKKKNHSTPAAAASASAAATPPVVGDDQSESPTEVTRPSATRASLPMPRSACRGGAVPAPRSVASHHCGDVHHHHPSPFVAPSEGQHYAAAPPAGPYYHGSVEGGDYGRFDCPSSPLHLEGSSSHAPYRSSSASFTNNPYAPVVLDGALHSMHQSLMAQPPSVNASFGLRSQAPPSPFAAPSAALTCPVCNLPRVSGEPKPAGVEVDEKVQKLSVDRAQWVKNLRTPAERRSCRCSEEVLLARSVAQPTFFIG